MLTLLLSACVDSTVVVRPEPTFIRVELVAGDAGSKESPLPFSSSPQSRTVRVTTENQDGDPYPFTGELTVNVRTGRLEQDTDMVTLTDGVWEGDVSFAAAFGPARIWFSDEGDRPGTTDRDPTYATGVSEPLWFHLPTLAEINIIEDGTTNQLAGEFAEIRSVDRNLRVTAVGTAGYWVQDLDDPPVSHNSMFVYTFSAPNPWVEVGQRIDLLTGSDQDYLGTTQLSFPHYTVAEDEVVDVPAPAPLTEALCGQDDTLEGYESAAVRIEEVWIPTTFTPGSLDYEDYIDYGQWPLAFESGGSSCVFYVDSTIAVPTFDPTEYAGTAFTSVEGMLFQVFDKWIILIRSADDLPLTFELESSGSGPSRPRGRAEPENKRKLK
jgi:hypothetical protein